MVTRSAHSIPNGTRLIALLVLVATAMSPFVDSASAQVSLSSTAPVDSAVHSVAPDGPHRVVPDGRRSLHPIRESLAAIDVRAIPEPGSAGASLQSPGPSRKKSVARRVLGGAIGATAGLFAGGYLGAAIEGDRCHCDDPGLKGALLGAPIGLVSGGILGALFLF